MEIQKLIRRRRHHPEEFKQAVIAACGEPGASVAGIALANSVNANQVRRWMREHGISAPTQCLPISTETETVPAFIPVSIAPTTAEAPVIRVEIRRGHAAVKIDWPPKPLSGRCVRSPIR